jgi:hypothetical protein
MQMWKLRLSRKPNLTQHGTRSDGLARDHDNRTILQVAILGLPAILMINHDPVATLPIPNGLGICETLVQGVISDTGHDARSGSPDRNAALHLDKVPQPEIDPVMSVIGQAPAVEILPFRRRILIDVILDEAINAQLAVDRASEFNCARAGAREAHQQDEGFSPVPRPLRPIPDRHPTSCEFTQNYR